MRVHQLSIAEWGGFALLFAVFAYCWRVLMPAAPAVAYAQNPAYFALLAATLTSLTLWLLRLLPQRRPQLEQLLLATFLAAMPVIYLWGVVLFRDGEALPLEAVGFLVFGIVAIVGYRRRSRLILALGIVAHGLLWDAWHHQRANYLEPWYPFGCLIIDIGLGLLALVQHGESRRAASAATSAAMS